MRAASPADEGLTDAIDFLRDATSIVVVAHVNPDADAIGAVVGLAGGLRALGKQVFPALSDPVPDYARFLDPDGAISSDLTPFPVDAIVCADAADIERLGAVYSENRGRFASTPVLNLDHHRTNPLYGQINFVDPAASSTSELCFRILEAMGAPIDAATATALLFGIVGDTGSFRNGATTPGALEAAAELLRHGADNQRVAFQLFECKRFVAARLWGRVLGSIGLDPGRRIVFAYLSQAELLSEGVAMDETEGIAEYLRGIEEADVVMLLKETVEGEVRVSMRSQPGVDVSLIATALGGGGHRQAAGCTLPGPFESAREALIETFDRQNAR